MKMWNIALVTFLLFLLFIYFILFQLMSVLFQVMTFFIDLVLGNSNNPGSGKVLGIKNERSYNIFGSLSGAYSGIRCFSQDLLLYVCEKPQATDWTASFHISLYFSDAMVPSFLGWFLSAQRNGTAR